MPEAEELLVDAARHATVAIQGLWKRHRPTPVQPTILLADIRPCLELLVEAVLGSHLPIRVAQSRAPVPLLRRLLAHDRISEAAAGPLPGNDGTSIYLPPSMPAVAGPIDDYHLLAVLQALRCERRSAALQGGAGNDLEMDLYLLAEAVASDCHLRRLLPGWGNALDFMYHRCAGNLETSRRTARLRAEVTTLYRAFLKGGRDAPPALPTPADSLDWARSRALSLVRRYPGEHYVPWLGDWVIGRPVLPDAAASHRHSPGMEHSPPLSHEPRRSAALSRRPRVRSAEDDEDDPSPGVWMIQTTEPQPHAEDPFGLNRPEDREADEDVEGSADSLAELDQARLIHSPSSSRECFFSSDPPPRREEDRTVTAASAGIAYPEWDYQTDSYRERAVRVFQVSAPDGPEDWSEAVLARHAGTLHDIRRRLATIRPDRHLIKNQTEGDDIDCDALVAERSERRAGIAPSGAFYQSHRPAPRRLGLVLLIDASASTDAWVGGHVRVIDVEKEAALLAAAALDDTGIDFAAMAFSGQGPQSVQARWIKGFDGPWDIGCRRRIAGLEPERYTRLGAALRHAAAILAACPVEHRLLLIFSDGRPNDCDRYASRYGIEDARQAVVEAQVQHILPYCFTVDREGGNYLPAIFGPSHYAVVQHPQQLPETFINWIQKAARHCR